MDFTAEMIAQLLNGKVEGDPGTKLNTIAKIEEGHAGALSFLANPKYEPYIYTTGSSAVLVRKDFQPIKEVKTTMIRVDDPYQSIARLLAIYEGNKSVKKGIHPSAVIDETASIGKDVYIGACTVISENAVIEDGCNLYAQVFIGENVKVGKNCTLYPGVKIYKDCLVGSNCIIHAGAVIGADGFGFAPSTDHNYMKIPQIGNVVIEDNVEIGANTCIDRATMGSTLVKHGVKLDNLVQIAHNVVIGENTVMAALSGVAGSSKVGKNCMIGGQVGIVGHVNVPDGCMMGAQTGVIGSVREENATLTGTPAINNKKYMRSYAYFVRLPELNKKVEEISERLKSLENKDI